MEEILKLIVIVAIGGLIGWMTNKIAIKMLFRPVNPKRFLFFKVQGVFPKRKDEMAVRLAQVIETELLSKDAILNSMFGGQEEELKEKLMSMLFEAINGKIPPVAKMFLGDNVEETIKEYLRKHQDEMFDQLMDAIKEGGQASIHIESLVKEKIDALDFEEFEEILFGLMKKELKHVEIIGLFLGGLIGFIQYLVSYFL